MIYAFYAFSFLAISASIGILFTRQLFHGALLLLICLLSIAGIYVVAYGEFVAVTQILVYAGGILVIIIFGIMLTTKIAGKPPTMTSNKWFAGMLLGVPLMISLLVLISRQDFSRSGMGHVSTGTAINRIGIELMTDYLLPFEVAGILLLVALIGAAVAASEHKKEETS